MGKHGKLCDDYPDSYPITEISKCSVAVYALEDYERRYTCKYCSPVEKVMDGGIGKPVNDNNLPPGCFVEFDRYDVGIPTGPLFNNAGTGARSHIAMPICTNGKNVKDHNCRSHVQII